MRILHAPYQPLDLGVHMVPGETLMLFHNDEQPLVERIILGMVDMLDENDEEARKTLMDVYEHVRSPEKQEVN